MARQFLTNIDFNSVAKIVNMQNPTAAQDAATKAYVDSAIEGLSWKDNVRVASTATLTLTGPGGTIDGITMTSGDRFLAKDQSTASQNGIYIWNGAAVAATRAPDANTSDELEGAVVVVDEGTSAGSSFRQTSVNFTLESGNIAWSSFISGAPAATETVAGIAELATQTEVNTGTDDNRIITPLKLANWSGRKLKFTQSIGDGSATSFNVDHNFNTRDIHVAVYRNSGSYDEVIPDVGHSTVNRVVLTFASAPTSAAFTCVVLA